MAYGQTPFGSAASTIFDEEFIGATSTIASTNGGGSSIADVIATNRFGCVRLTAGANAGNYAALDCRANLITTTTYVPLYFRASVAVPVLGATFVATAGFSTNSTTATVANQIKFRYNSGENGGRWQCVTRKASVETNSNSGITVVAGQFYELEFFVTSTSVVFKIDGVTVATNTTNIPGQVAGQAMQPGVSSHRAAAGGGAVDCCRIKIEIQ